MQEPDETGVGASDPFGWKDPPGMGKVLVVSSAIGVGLSLVFITVGMMAAGQVWQSSLALGVFIACWGGLGFGSMVGGVVYLKRIDDAAQALKAEGAAPRTATVVSEPATSNRPGSHSADAA